MSCFWTQFHIRNHASKYLCLNVLASSKGYIYSTTNPQYNDSLLPSLVLWFFNTMREEHPSAQIVAAMTQFANC